MATKEMKVDADLFTAIHRALDEQERSAPPERRQTERRSFQCLQLLAPFDGATMPSVEDYTRMRCHDLSPSGFSYIADARPASKLLVAALGRTPLKFFVAEVVNVRPIDVEGMRKLLVGCRFVRRID